MTRAREESTTTARNQPLLRTYDVWDRATRWLHWTNAVIFSLSAAVGFLFAFRDDLHIAGRASKIALKELHSVIGYSLLLGVCLRLLWGFFGNSHVRWRAVLPGKDSIQPALREARAILKNQPWRHELGHGPLGRFSTALMFSALLLMLGTGLIRATTDLYYPPFGHFVAAYVAKPGVAASRINPFDDDLRDPVRVRRVGMVQGLAGKLHSLGAWALLGLVLLHVAGVILKEVRHGGGLFSAMFTGKKVFSSPAAENDDDPT